MAFGQTREEKLRNFKEMPKTKSEEPQTVIPTGNIGIVNLEQKKKPHNVTIQNYNKNEPKIKANIKYSAKQSFRRYKTKTEPNLLSKIQVNEDDDIVNKIKEALGIKTESKNSNYTETETSSVPFYKGVDDLPAENITDRREPIARKEIIGISELLNENTDRREPIGEKPVPRETYLMDEITDISMEDSEELTNWFTDNEWKTRVENEAANLLKYNIGKRISRKANEKLAKDLSDAMTISQLDDIKKNIIVSEAKRGNKTVGLDWYADNSPKRTERYSFGLDVALPTPKKMNFQPKTRDAETSMRGAGRPPTASYRNANPTRASVGEMTNPTAY